MDNEKKFNREEFSRILKIAAELDHKAEITEEGLSESELRKIAEEVGIAPIYIQEAILQLKNKDFDEYRQTITEENFSFRKQVYLNGTINEGLWEDIVTEIRRINGGIGKTSRLGKSYEWEQRKKNIGYLQVSVTPKDDYIRLVVNTSYKYYSSVMELFGGTIGFTLFLILAKNISIPILIDNELILGMIGAIGGWAMTRLYLKSWMRKKRQMLQSLSQRLTTLITGNQQPQLSTKVMGHKPEIELGSHEEETENSGHTTSRSLRNR